MIHPSTFSAFLAFTGGMFDPDGGDPIGGDTDVQLLINAGARIYDGAAGEQEIEDITHENAGFGSFDAASPDSLHG